MAKTPQHLIENRKESVIESLKILKRHVTSAKRRKTIDWVIEKVIPNADKY